MRAPAAQGEPAQMCPRVRLCKLPHLLLIPHRLVVPGAPCPPLKLAEGPVRTCCSLSHGCLALPPQGAAITTGQPPAGALQDGSLAFSTIKGSWVWC